MAFQLIYTSSPRLLQVGRTGFGTVAKHSAVRGALQSEIERFSQFSRQEGLHPGRTVFQYRIVAVSGETFHVVSRLKDAGADYTGRTNHIAHHVIFSSLEASEAHSASITPVDVIYNLSSNSFWKDSWHDGPTEFGEGDHIRVSSLRPALSLPAVYWQGVTGDSSCAAILAPGQIAESCWIVYRQDQSDQILALYGESLLLHTSPWRVSFANELQPTDRVDEIAWRGIPSDSPLRGAAAQSVRPTLDLSSPLTLPSPVAEFAPVAAHGRSVSVLLSQTPEQLSNPSGAALPTSKLTVERRSAITSPSRSSPSEGSSASPRPKSLKSLKRATIEAGDGGGYSVLKPVLVALFLLLVLGTGGAVLYFQQTAIQERDSAGEQFRDAAARFRYDALKINSQSESHSIPEHADAKSLREGVELYNKLTERAGKAFQARDTPEQLRSLQGDIEALKKLADEINSYPGHSEVRNSLNTSRNRLTEKVKDHLEQLSIKAMVNGQYDRLKAFLDASPEFSSSAKGIIFSNVSTLWSEKKYAELIDYIAKDDNKLKSSISKLDEVLAKDNTIDFSFLKSVDEKLLKQYPNLAERIAVVPKAAEIPEDPVPPVITDAKLMPRPAQLDELPDPDWILVNDEEYRKRIEEERNGSKSVFIPEKPNQQNQMDLLFESFRKPSPRKTLNSATVNAAHDALFIFILNKDSLPEKVLINYSNLTPVPYQLDSKYFEFSKGEVKIVNDVLFKFLTSQRIHKNDGSRILFYYALVDGEKKQISDRILSFLSDLKNAEAELQSVQKRRDDLEKNSVIDPAQIHTIELWLGDSGPVSTLFETPKSFKMFSEKGPTSSNEGLIDLLRDKDIYSKLSTYVKGGIEDFKRRKGTTIKKDWTKENVESFQAILNAMPTSKIKSADEILNNGELSTKGVPPEVLAVFDKSKYSSSAEAFDKIATSQRKRSQALTAFNSELKIKSERVRQLLSPRNDLRISSSGDSFSFIIAPSPQ